MGMATPLRLVRPYSPIARPFVPALSVYLAKKNPMRFYCTDHRNLLAVLAEDDNSHDPKTVRRVCAELSRLILQRNVVRLEMVKEGVLKVLYNIVVDHVEQEPLVLSDCCRFLQKTISLREPNELDIQSKIAECGYLTLMAKGLASHPKSSELFVNICRLVALLCFDMPTAPHVDNQADTAASGLLATICERLRTPTINEEEALRGCEAVHAMLYENASAVECAVDNSNIVTTFAKILSAFSDSSRVVKIVSQTNFQILALHPSTHDEFVTSGVFDQVLGFLEKRMDSTSSRSSGCSHDLLVEWHVLTFVELTTRWNDAAKDALCRGKASLALIATATHIHRLAGSSKSSPTINHTMALNYLTCMLLCRIATVGDPPVVHKDRVRSLVHASAHQFVIDLLKGMGSGSIVCHVAEQAVRFLEIVATLEENRIPLTRLGASRHVKVIYNHTEKGGLQVLCERAVAVIEGK